MKKLIAIKLILALVEVLSIGMDFYVKIVMYCFLLIFGLYLYLMRKYYKLLTT